jgi:hypothetical protein
MTEIVNTDNMDYMYIRHIHKSITISVLDYRIIARVVIEKGGAGSIRMCVHFICPSHHATMTSSFNLKNRLILPSPVRNA